MSSGEVKSLREAGAVTGVGETKYLCGTDRSPVSLAMEAAPRKWRGILSGILQSGYSIGYLLAAMATRFLLPHWGWRAMFWIGAVPALLALYIRAKVPESQAWKEHKAASTGEVLTVVAKHWKRFAYLVVLMTFMMFLSHGTQDLYPDFLHEVRGVGQAVRANIAIIYNKMCIRDRIGRARLAAPPVPAIGGCAAGRGEWQMCIRDRCIDSSSRSRP